MKKVYDMVYNALLTFCKILLVADISIVTFDVISRYVFGRSLSWGQEIVQICMVYLTLLSASLAIRRDAHIRITMYDKKLPKRVRITMDLIIIITICIFMAVVGYEGFWFAMNQKGGLTALPWFSRTWIYMSVPIASVFILFIASEKIADFIRMLAASVEASEEGGVE